MQTMPSKKDDIFCLDTSDARSRSRGCLQVMPCQEEENEVKSITKKSRRSKRRRVHSIGVHKDFIPMNRG